MACSTCQGTGLVPFIKPDGTVSKHAKIFCRECHDEYGLPYPYALKPSDIDYSVSYSVYRSLCREHGWQDPGPLSPSEGKGVEKPQEQVIVHRHSNMSKQDSDVLQQTARRVQHLEKKVAELQTKRKANQGEY